MYKLSAVLLFESQMHGDLHEKQPENSRCFTHTKDISRFSQLIVEVV